MKIKDMAAMMSVGALFAFGIMFAVDKVAGADDAQQTVAIQAPVQLQAQGAPTTQPVQQTAAPEDVTSASIDLLSQSTASQIGRIVALSREGLNRTAQLTPEQAEIIKFFERTAREMNQQDKAAANGHVHFVNMAVRGLNVRYFYRVPQAYDDVNSAELLEKQRMRVRRNLCENDAIRTLLSDYGFAYTYTYVSRDSRKIGEISANAAVCA